MQRIFNLALALSCLLLLPINAAAQQPSAAASPELKQDLQRIGATANELILSMPSFTCDEAAVSQAVRDHKVVRSVSMNGVVRTIRKPNGRMVETYDYKRGHILLIIPRAPPLFVSGGFATALAYFLPSSQACYVYSLSPGRIDFTTRTDPASANACLDRGLRGFALLNALGNVSHIERTIPPEVAKPPKLATFAAVDLSPVELNGRMYQLSNHMVAEMPLGEATGHFEATYSNCQLFTTTVTLGPSTEVPADTTTKPQ
jgi:hypothetical protein